MADTSTSHGAGSPAAHGHSKSTGPGLLGRPLECVVVSPEATVLETTADFVALPLYDGELGIAPGHSPLIGRLGYGELRIVSGNQTRRYYVDGGFVQVAANVVSVLTARAILTSEIDPRIAAEQLSAAKSRRTAGDTQLAERDVLETQARAQLRVARKG